MQDVATEHAHALSPPDAMPTEQDAQRAELRARIDDERLILIPSAIDTQVDGFDADKAAQALTQATQSTYQVQWQGALWGAASETHQVSFDTETGVLSIADTGDYEPGLSHAPDTQVLAHATELFEALAADTANAAIEIKHLGVTNRQVGDPNSNVDERIGSKVFALRRLNGLRVAGSRMVASYKTDGTLRTVRGLWPTIDLSHSKLASELSRNEAIELALSTLLRDGVQMRGDDRISLETFYELRRDPALGTWVAVLRAAATNQTYGPDGPSRIERHDFDL